MSRIHNAPRNCTHFVGIDEVGRGPIAGPVAVAAVLLYSKKSCRHLQGIKDSKKLSPAQREKWLHIITELQNKQLLDFAVSFTGNKIIDSQGIEKSTHAALARTLKQVHAKPRNTYVLLDGRLAAPTQFLFQETITRGDEKEPLIAAASIVAKVCRDRKMVLYAQKFNRYGFEQHKGYGTKKHYHALRKHGTCDIHRKSFL